MDKKTLDRNFHKRKININMPQMHWGGMSENWLLKEFGDIHWSMISDGLGIESDKLTDSNGERLYSSFVRLRWESNISLFEIKENCEVALSSKLSRFGNKMFFSDTQLITSGKSMSASLMSVFSSRTAEDNTTLKKGAPVVSTDAKIRTLSKIPLFAKEYLAIKSDFFSDIKNVKDSTVELSGVVFPINASPIYIQDYIIEPFDDINGVGLIYFASYSKISDKCERNYFHKQNDKNEKWKDWAHNSSCIARDIFYFGNANPDEILIYKLEVCKLIDSTKIQLSSSLYRKSDGQLIAKIFTIKQISESIFLDSKTEEIIRIDEKEIDLEQKEINTNQIAHEEKLPLKSSKLTNLNNEIFNKEAINKIVINFLCSVLDEKNIDELTDLKLLGIESVIYMELSEHLNCEFQIPSNPSRFYGLHTVRDITSYLTDNKSEDIKPIKKTVKHKQNDVESEADTFDVAIIGSAFNFPGAKTKEELWKLLIDEKSVISSTPETRFKWPQWVDLNNDHKGIDKAGYISEIDKFDASFFRISPRDAELMDPQQRMLLELTWELIEESGYKASNLNGSDTGVFIGASGSDYELLLEEQAKQETLTGTGTSLAILANRLSFFYDFKGPSLQIDAACSSSLVAIHQAINSLKLGDCKQVIAGGIHLMCHPRKSLSYHQSNMLSTEGRCKTFDENANGYVRGEGAALLFLKPLSKALEDGDTIHGIVKGSAVNSGGNSGGLTVPNPEKQSELIQEAYTRAQIPISSVSYIEAHGTGTSLGDPIEISALTKAFNCLNQSANSKKKTSPWCGIGSVKTNLGHLEAAAGMAGILKVLLSMKNKQLPATINFERLNSKIELEGSPFYIQNKTMPWDREFSHQPLRAGISSFGIGGTNAHVVIEEYVNASLGFYSGSVPAVILLSAKNSDRLAAQVLNLKNWLPAHPGSNLYDIAYTLQLGRESMEERLALVCGDLKELEQQLSSYLAGTLKGHLRGNIKKEKSDFSLTGGAGHAYISYALAHQESRSLAQLWIKGISVDWNLLYPLDKPNKISLPSYPFARERYWMPEQKAVLQPQGMIHPLVHRNISSLKQVKYSSFYNGDESFLMDHRVNSQRILPGVAYLELAREAGSHCMECRVTQLRDVTWLQPVVINGSSKEVQISLYPLGEDASYKIYTHDASGEQVHSQGILSTQLVPSAVIYDLGAIQDRLLQSKAREVFYELFRSQGLDLGNSFQGIQHFYYSENEALSKIELSGKPGYILTPGVLDSAIQTCIGLNFDIKDKGLELPFSVREVTIYGDLPASLWAYARKSSNHKPLDKITSYDIDLLNDAGEVLVSLKDFVTLPLSGISVAESLTRKNKQEEESSVYLYDMLWQPSPPVKRLSAEIPDSGLILLVGGFAELANLLKTSLKREVEVIAHCDEESYFGLILERLQIQLEMKNRLDLTIVCESSDYVHYGFISGLLRTAMQEHPKFSGKIIVVERLSDIGELTAVLELEASTGDIEVRYLDGNREVKTSNPVIEPVGSSVRGIKPGGVYLITGGAGGLGLIFADYISRTKNTRVILTGRSELSADGQLVLSRLSQAEYLRCDVANKLDVYSLIDTIKSRYKKLDGIIHSAGVLRDSFVVKKTVDEFSKVLKPKIAGVKNLDEATRQEALDFMVYFSSIASVKGNLGQSDYASANAYLDNYASYRNEECFKGNAKGRTLSVNWPLWKEGGMQVDAEFSQHMEKQWGMLALPTAEGLVAFEALLKSNLDQGIVAFGKQSDILEKHSGKFITSVSPLIFSPGDSSAIVNKATTNIIKMAARLLKLEAHDIEADEKLGDYGFDSILLTKFSNELNNYYDLDLMPTVFFNYPTIKSLIEFLLEDHSQSLFKQHGSEDKSSAQIPEIVAMENKRDDKVGIDEKMRFFSDEWQHEAPVIGINQVNLEPIAIIGMSGRFPGSPDLPSYWENIKANKDLITEIPIDRWDWKKYYGDPQEDKNKTKAKWGGFIEDIDKFDPLFFNISPREAELMDPQQRITLQTVYKALEDAGITTDKIKGTNTGVFIGVSTGDYSLLLSKHTDLTSKAQFSTGSAYSILVNRISYLLDIHGPSEPIDTACSSSLIAIHKAVENIRNGHCDMAIAGGVNALLSPELTLSFSQAGMLSEDGRCKTFDQRANGYVRGEGVGVVILKSLAKAEQDGDHIYGLIRGSAENHGGKANTLTSPNPNAQKELLIKAYRGANIDPRDVSYIEAHGTGTPLGDPIEAEGLKSAFKELYKERNLSQPEVAYCGLGSVKANIGHLEAAAGMGGIIKVLLSMKHKILPGNPQLETPNEYLKLEGSPFYLQKETKAWVTENNKPRIAGISSFGFGGANAHIVIEEYCPVPKEKYSSAIPAIVVLSARNQDRLKEQVANLKIYLEMNQDIDFHDMVYTLQIGREPMEERLAIVSNDKEELIEKLTRYLKGSNDDCDEGIIFRGNIRKEKLYFLLEGKAGRAYLQTAVKNRESKCLAQLWVKGISMDWTLFYPDSQPSKISLPTYPFHMKRYWFDNTAFKTNQVVEVKQNLSSHNIIFQGNGENQKIDPVKLVVRDYNSDSEPHIGKRVTANLIFQKEKFPSSSVDKSPNQSIVLTKEQITSILLSELCELLYLEKEELESSKVFSELGLDSILGVELIKIVNKRFSIDLKVSKLYDYPSIAQLSNYLNECLSDLSEQYKVTVTSANQARTISPVQPDLGKLELVSLENYVPVCKTTELNIKPIGLLKIDESIETALPASAEKANEGGGAYLRKHLQDHKQINNTVLN